MRYRGLGLGILCAMLAAPPAVLGGDLEPPGPPAPTMRTLDSLGFDCPNDPPDTTNLLFTFVSNQAGFDTGFSISNTGADPFGTVGQTGTCTLSFFGVTSPNLPAPPPLVTPSIAPGGTYPNILSSAAPGFQGYMIAVCNFSYAHGYAFISDVGAQRLASSYVAQTICRDRKWNLGAGQ